MLVLRRKLGEVIRIGTNVTVRVLEFRGNQVHLGLEAPADVKIFREEVYKAMAKESEETTGPIEGIDGPGTFGPGQRETPASEEVSQARRQTLDGADAISGEAD